MSEPLVCSECEEEKEELTVHGTCWKCHLKGIRFNARIEARLPSKPAQSQKVINKENTIEI